jgi:hypothetical protein
MFFGLALTLVSSSLAASLAASLPSGHGELVLSPSTTLWILDPADVGYGARSAVSLALRDVQNDWYMVIGTRPSSIVSDTDSDTDTHACPPDFVGTCVFFGRAASSRAQPVAQHPEAHAIVVKAVSAPAQQHHVYLTGNSERAEVFAMYTFAERVLGVQPLWWWTDTLPVYRGTLSFPNPTENVAIEFGAPVFQQRGWFPNDEDLLGNFKPDPLGQSVFSAETWNRIAEALLRLKGNLVIAGTVSFPDESHYEVLARRGVAASMQHFTMLGVNTWRWPQGIPYSFNENPEIQEFAWQASVDAYKGREAVWTIGYRGLNDYPFWNDEPSFNTTASRCQLISAAMRKQAEIVRATPGREHDVCVTYMWSEMLDLFLSGQLIIPENTSVVFADAGGQGTFDPRVFPQLKEGDGAYFHVQMESPGTMSQLTEMVPPASFYRELSKFVKAGATSYFMLNLSDLKPAAFLVDTIMRYLWDPTTADEMDSPEDAQDAAVASWTTRHFGEEFAERASIVIRDYFNVSYIVGDDPRRFGDEHLSGLVRKLLKAEESPRDALAFVEIPLAQLKPLFTSAQALYRDMKKADAPGAPFFQASFLLFVATHWFGCNAIQDTARGDYAAARSNLAELRSFQRKAEQVKWRGMYGADRLVDFGNLDCLLGAAEAEVRMGGTGLKPDPPNCNLPNGRSYHSGTGKWSDWFMYGNTTTNFPYLNPVEDKSKSTDLFVRVLCDVETPATGHCVNTPVGGLFNGTQVRLSMNTLKSDGVTIRYTLDGSDPTQSSPVYTSPVAIEKTTKIAAKAFGNDENFGLGYPTLVVRPVFTHVDSEI